MTSSYNQHKSINLIHYFKQKVFMNSPAIMAIALNFMSINSINEMMEFQSSDSLSSSQTNLTNTNSGLVSLASFHKSVVSYPMV